MIIVPYRVKNPPKTFPVATVTLIALNALVFLLASHSFLVIRREIVDAYALRWGVSPVYTILTSMFLHGDVLHLSGNMLFLWVFGPAVEDRMKVPGYLGLYFLAGFAGIVAQVALGAAGLVAHSIPMLGASGCIMGVLGAYWYMYSWSPVCMFWLVGWFWKGTFEMAAVWVIGVYFALDLLQGCLSRSSGSLGGVASFAHVGGALIGALLVYSMGVKRDSKDVSSVKATAAAVGDANLLESYDMWTLIEESPEDEALLTKYALKAMNEIDFQSMKQALERDSRTVLTHCPEVALYYLLNCKDAPEPMTPADLLYLGKWSESMNRIEPALKIFRLIDESRPECPEAEMALFREAHILSNWKRDKPAALDKLDLLLSRFPNGSLALDAQDLRDELAPDQGLSAA